MTDRGDLGGAFENAPYGWGATVRVWCGRDASISGKTKVMGRG